MMRAIVVEEAGGADALCLKDVPRPSAGGTAPLGPEEVLVANAYAGVNFIDTYQRSGLYPIKMPAVLGREGAGVVTAVGEAVSEVRPGQKVAYLSPGAYAEETRVAAKHVAVLPESVSLEEGGAALLQGMTAAYLTHYSYRVSKGDCVLIPAAAGGTGGILCQMANALGATVIGLASSAEKAAIASTLGAHHTIIYGDGGASESIPDAVMRLTGGRGANVVYDGVGRDFYRDGLASLAKRGTYINFGNASGKIDAIDPFDLTPRCLSFMRPSLFGYIDDRADFLYRTAAARLYERLALSGVLLDMIAAKQVSIRIHNVYDMEHARDAHRDLESRKTMGKLVIAISGRAEE